MGVLLEAKVHSAEQHTITVTTTSCDHLIYIFISKHVG